VLLPGSFRNENVNFREMLREVLNFVQEIRFPVAIRKKTGENDQKPFVQNTEFPQK
jgi:hypothetical protein